MGNMDKTGCFWRALPVKCFDMKGKQCKGGKKCKQRMPMALFVNAAGEKKTPVIFGSQRIHDVLKALTKANFQYHTSASRNPG